MRKLQKALLLVGLVLLTACGAKEEGTETVEPTIAVVSSNPTAVTLNQLANNPSAFAAAYIELSGQFKRMPFLICAADAHPGPAHWEIASETDAVPAGGFNSQLRSVVPEGMRVTVQGRWQLWQGIVGCGDDAVSKSVWYLAVDKIVSPSPLAQVSLTPSGGVGDSVDTQSLSPAEPPEPTVTGKASSDLNPTPVLLSTATAPPASGTTPGPTASPGLASSTPSMTPTGPSPTSPSGGTPTIAATATLGATGSATATLAGSVTAAATGSPSPTPTFGATATNTPTAAVSATATQAVQPTATPTTASTVVNKGPVSPEELAAESLGSNELHAWDFSITASDAITVSVAASPTIDIIISILDDAGNTLMEQNSATAGFIERIANYPLPAAGDYQVQIRSQNGAAGHYSMLLLLNDSYNFVAQGILTYGSTQGVSLAADSDHFWFFHGNSGDLVTITLIPGDNGDLFFELYGTDASDLAGFIDNGLGGEQEELVDFTLPNTGVYAIRLGEYDFMPSVYQIILTSS